MLRFPVGWIIIYHLIFNVKSFNLLSFSELFYVLSSVSLITWQCGYPILLFRARSQTSPALFSVLVAKGIKQCYSFSWLLYWQWLTIQLGCRLIEFLKYLCIQPIIPVILYLGFNIIIEEVSHFINSSPVCYPLYFTGKVVIILGINVLPCFLRWNVVFFIVTITSSDFIAYINVSISTAADSKVFCYSFFMLFNLN